MLIGSFESTHFPIVESQTDAGFSVWHSASLAQSVVQTQSPLIKVRLCRQTHTPGSMSQVPTPEQCSSMMQGPVTGATVDTELVDGSVVATTSGQDQLILACQTTSLVHLQRPDSV